MLQSAVIRHSPEDPDGASGFFVAAFQVGIMAGAVLGGLLFELAGVPAMLAAPALLIVAALVGARRVRSPAHYRGWGHQREVTLVTLASINTTGQPIQRGSRPVCRTLRAPLAGAGVV